MTIRFHLQVAGGALILLACGNDPEPKTAQVDAAATASESEAGVMGKHTERDAGAPADVSSTVDARSELQPRTDASASGTDSVAESPLSDFELAAAIDKKLRECGVLADGITPFDPSAIDRCALLCELGASCEQAKSAECDHEMPAELSKCVTACPDLLPETFACGGGKTVPLGQYCDLKPDCENGEDEKHCAPFACKDGMSKVSPARVCDQSSDCLDSSDETGCASLCGEAAPIVWDPNKR